MFNFVAGLMTVKFFMELPESRDHGLSHSSTVVTVVMFGRK